jgi:hypothetical protein
MDIKAGVYGRPITVVDEPEATALGAALLGGLAQAYGLTWTRQWVRWIDTSMSSNQIHCLFNAIAGSASGYSRSRRLR